MIFALLSMFFRSRFRGAFRKAEKSTTEPKKTNSGVFGGRDCGGPQAPGERKREGEAEIIRSKFEEAFRDRILEIELFE